MAKSKSRASWRQKQAEGSKARLWILVRRSVATTVVLGLLLGFLYALLKPIFDPSTYLLYITAAQRMPTNGAPIAYAFEDFDALSPLEGALAKLGDQRAQFRGLEQPATALAHLKSLRENGFKENDRLIFMLTAHGLVEDGKAYLKCSNYEAPATGEMEVAAILQAISDLPCRTKLVMFDARRAAWEPQVGDESPEFERLLRDKVRELADPGLWVMTSSSGLEQSHVVPALRQSVFGYVVSRGLAGAADQNEDNSLGLHEFYQFVYDNVLALTQHVTDREETQTPQLFHCEPLAWQQLGSPTLLSLRNVEKETQPDIEQDLQQAETQNQEGLLDRVASKAVDISGQFGIPSPTSISQRLARFRRRSGSQEKPPAEDGEEPEAPMDEADPEAEPEQVAARELAACWKLVDQLEVPTTGQVKSRPMDAAPALWRQLKHDLLWFDQLHRAGAMIDQRHVMEQVINIKRQLRYLAQDPLAQQPGPSTLAARIDLQRVPVPENLARVPSLGALSAVMRQTGGSLGEAHAAVTQSWEALLKANTAAGVTPWLESAKKLDADLAEIRAAELTMDLGLDWPLAKVLLEATYLGEEVASDFACAAGWGQHAVESGDRALLEARRILVIRNDPQWERRARQELEMAAAFYRDARDVHELVHRAHGQRDEAVARGRAYLDWLAVNDAEVRTPTPQDFAALCQAVTKVDRLLEQGVPQAAETDRELIQALSDAVADLDDTRRTMAEGLRQLVSGGEEVWPLATLRESVLVSAGEREQLAQQKQAVAQWMQRFEFKSVSPTRPVATATMTDMDWSRAKTRMDMEVELAALAATGSSDALTRLQTSPGVADVVSEAVDVSRLGGGGFTTVRDVAMAKTDALAEVLSDPATTAAVRQEQAETLRDKARWTELASFTDRLSSFYAQIPGAVDELLRTARSLEFQPRLQHIRRAKHVAQLMQGGAALEGNPGEEALRAATHGFFAWQARRALLAREDAGLAEWERATAEYDRLAQQADAISGYASLPPAPDPSLRIVVPPELTLEEGAGEQGADLAVDVRSSGSQRQPVWLVVQYDSTKVSVAAKRGTSGPAPIYQEDNLRRRLANVDGPLASPSLRHVMHRAQYPYRPDLAGVAETVVVPAGGRMAVPLQVRLKPGARGRTDLVVKVVGKQEYLRSVVPIKLPGDHHYQLVLEDPLTRELLPPEELETVNGGVVVMPYPNRSRTMLFSVRDLSHRDSKIQVELLRPTRRPGLLSVPTGVMDADQATQVLRAFGSPSRLAKSEELTLAADQTIPVPLAMEASIQAPAAEGAEGPAMAPQLVQYGLLLLITDVQRNQKTLKQIHFSLQRPSGYVTAQADYNRAQRRLSIRLQVDNAHAVPEDGLLAKLSFEPPIQFPEGASRQRENRFQASQVGPAPVALLHAPVDPVDYPEVTAHVEIDGFPRAFVFRVNTTEDRRAVEPEKDLRRIKVIPPDPNQISVTELKKTNSIPVRVEVDAPAQSFATMGEDRVEVGVDANRDRDLTGDRLVTVFADRQVELYLTEIGLVGSLRFRCDVSDFQLQLPAMGLENQEPFLLLGRLRIGGPTGAVQESERPHATMKIDGSGPVISGAAVVLGGRETQRVIVDEEALVRVTTTDATTDVARVEIGFSRDRGDPEEVPADQWWPAVQVAGGTWQGAGKIPQLTLGVNRLWIRATDAVGNERHQHYDVIVIPKPAPPATSEDPSPVAGTPGGATSPGVTPPAPRAKFTVIAGRARYAKRFVADAAVTLLQGGNAFRTATSKADGRFEVKRVPAGEYTLAIRGIAGGNIVKGEQAVKVEDPGAGPIRLGEVRLK